MLRRIVSAGEDLCRFARYHISAARPGADKNESAKEIGSLHCDFLRDHAADGKAEHIDLGKPESPDEGDRVCAHPLNARRDPA
jgi:hypothetical protein